MDCTCSGLPLEQSINTTQASLVGYYNVVFKLFSLGFGMVSDRIEKECAMVAMPRWMVRWSLGLVLGHFQ
jgi:hypothetical protein